MGTELAYLANRTLRGLQNRRAFLGRAGALGMSLFMANSVLAATAQSLEPQRGGILRVGMHGGDYADSMDPLRAISALERFNLRCVGDTLMEMGADGRPQPSLAESLEPSPDGRAWAIRLRSGVYFHNGQAVTAADVAATLMRHADPQNGSGASGLLAGIESVMAETDHVLVTFSRPHPWFSEALTDYRLVIQPAPSARGDVPEVFSGAYIPQLNEPGVRHHFTRNPNDWRQDRGYVNEIEVLVINDHAARMAALSAGQIDLANRADPRRLSEIAALPDVQVMRGKSGGRLTFSMHTGQSPFNNSDLRLALKHALNRDNILSKVFNGYGRLGNDMPFAAEGQAFLTGIEQRAYDPEKAAWHYRRAGHDGLPLVLRVSDIALPGAREAAELFSASAAQAGIPVEVRREPAEGYFTEVWNRKPFTTSYQDGVNSAGRLLSTYHLSSSAWNETRYGGEALDRLVMEARESLDPALQEARFADAARLIHNEGGSLVPVHCDSVELCSTKVQGFAPGSDGEMMGGAAGIRVWLSA